MIHDIQNGFLAVRGDDAQLFNDIIGEPHGLGGIIEGVRSEAFGLLREMVFYESEKEKQRLLNFMGGNP